MAASWQHEYERSWRGYAQRALVDVLGPQYHELEVSQDDRLHLAALLQSLGVRDHAAPQPSTYVRYTAPPARTRRSSSRTVAVVTTARTTVSEASCAETLVIGDSSVLSEASYVYSTPPRKSNRRASSQYFPQFSSQDFLPDDSAATARRESASQTLRLRMAGVSPIASVREQQQPRRRNRPSSPLTPRTDLPTSQSVLLRASDDAFSTPRPDAAARATHWPDQVHAPAPAAAVHDLCTDDDDDDDDGPDARHHRVGTLDVSMQSMNLSDDDNDDSAANDDDERTPRRPQHAALGIDVADDDDDDNDAQEEHDDVPKVLRFSSCDSDNSDDAMDDNAFEFGHASNDALDEPDAEMDAAIAPVDNVAVKVEESDSDFEALAVVPPPRPMPLRAPVSTGMQRTRSNNSRSNRLTNVALANASRESCGSVDSIHDDDAATATTARPRSVFQTRLPLEIEYRNTTVDWRRRKQRRKSLNQSKELGVYRMPEFRVELAAYQQRAVAWMHARERFPKAPVPPGQCVNRYARITDKVQGGILADEMGLGKTVCCIALICESLKHSREACRRDTAAASGGSSNNSSSRATALPRIRPPTLIITPLSILNQWANEIRQKTNLSVITYHGTARKSYRSAIEFMGADIVLSTYDTLRLKECKVSVDGPMNHGDGGNDDDSDDSGGGNAAATDRTASTASTTSRTSEPPSEWRSVLRNTAADRRSVVASKLHQLAWHRIILDESHLITNASCARARAAQSLQSKRRWCVTGTPIQNSSSDLASLVAFLGVPSTSKSSSSELHEILPHIMLRRLKTTVDSVSHEPILTLPAKVEEIIELRFASELEEAFYTLLHRSTKRQVLQYLQQQRSGSGSGGASALPQFMHVFELLLRLRQTCNSFMLVTSDPVTEMCGRGTLLLAEASASMTPGAKTTRLVQRVEAQYASRELQSPAVAGATAVPVPALPQSTKLTALLTQLDAVKAANERALVISQWTGFLDLIAESLAQRNAAVSTTSSSTTTTSSASVVSFGKLDGRMAAREREQVVALFQTDRRLDVLLISLRTGGMGLNLTAASHVFIMEPSWNPSVESQAIDRAHRFGQTRRVRVVRFIMKHTIEERVVVLQRKKRALASTLLGDASSGRSGNAAAVAVEETRLTRAELRQLFTDVGTDDDDECE